MAEVCSSHWVHDSSCDACRALTLQASQAKDARQAARRSQQLVDEFQAHAAWERRQAAHDARERARSQDEMESRLWSLESEVDSLRARAETAEAALDAQAHAAEAQRAAAALEEAERQREAEAAQARAERAAARAAAQTARQAASDERRRVRLAASALDAMSRMDRLRIELQGHVARVEELIATGDTDAPELVARQVAIRHLGTLVERLRDDWRVEQDNSLGLNPIRHLPMADRWVTTSATQRDIFRQGREALGEPGTPISSPDDVNERLKQLSMVWHQVALDAADARTLLASLAEAFPEVDSFELLDGVGEVVVPAESAILEEEMARPHMEAARAAHSRWVKARGRIVESLDVQAHKMRRDGRVLVLPADLADPTAYADMLAALALPTDPGTSDPGPEESRAVTAPGAGGVHRIPIRQDQLDAWMREHGLPTPPVSVPGEPGPSRQREAGAPEAARSGDAGPQAASRDMSVPPRRKWGFGRGR